MRADVISFLFTLLALTLGLQWLLEHIAGNMSRVNRTYWAFVTALSIVLIPVQGIPVARWLASINASVSIPLLTMLLNGIWARSSGAPLMDGKSRRTAWIFGLTGGLFLYPMALGWGSFDPYEPGYGSVWLLLSFMGLTLLLLQRKNLFGAVLVVAILAYDLHLLESRNVWDYFVDPLYALSSFVALIVPFSKKASHHTTHQKELPRQNPLNSESGKTITPNRDFQCLPFVEEKAIGWRE
jgi:hypothetical protein